MVLSMLFRFAKAVNIFKRMDLPYYWNEKLLLFTKLGDVSFKLISVFSIWSCSLWKYHCHGSLIDLWLFSFNNTHYQCDCSYNWSCIIGNIFNIIEVCFKLIYAFSVLQLQSLKISMPGRAFVDFLLFSFYYTLY